MFIADICKWPNTLDLINLNRAASIHWQSLHFHRTVHFHFFTSTYAFVAWGRWWGGCLHSGNPLGEYFFGVEGGSLDSDRSGDGGGDMRYRVHKWLAPPSRRPNNHTLRCTHHKGPAPVRSRAASFGKEKQSLLPLSLDPFYTCAMCYFFPDIISYRLYV